jgi:hypothetical protein
MNKQLAGLVLVAAVAAGCGSATSTASVTSGGASGSSTSPAPSGSPDPLATQSAPAGPVRALPTSAKSVLSSQKRISLPWRFVRLTDGGKKVEISLQYGGCMSLSYVQVVQTSGAVQLTVWGTQPKSGKTICPAFEALINGTVTLSAPLGSRQLLHGAISAHGGLLVH